MACAGVIQSIDFLDLTEKDIRTVFDVNVVGTFLLGQLAAHRMVELKRLGSLVNFSAVIAHIAGSDQTSYALSKGPVESLTRAMALALVKHRVRVNAVGPGVTDTPMLKTVMTDETRRRAMLSQTPLGRLARPEEIAALVLFLASNEAAYTTGQTYYANGGRLVLNCTVPVAD